MYSKYCKAKNKVYRKGVKKSFGKKCRNTLTVLSMDSKTLNLTVMGLSTAAVTVVIILSNNSHSSCRNDPKWPRFAITWQKRWLPQNSFPCVNFCHRFIFYACIWIAHLWTSQVQVDSIAVRQDFKGEFNCLQPNLNICRSLRHDVLFLQQL